MESSRLRKIKATFVDLNKCKENIQQSSLFSKMIGCAFDTKLNTIFIEAKEPELLKDFWQCLLFLTSVEPWESKSRIKKFALVNGLEFMSGEALVAMEHQRCRLSKNETAIYLHNFKTSLEISGELTEETEKATLSDILKRIGEGERLKDLESEFYFTNNLLALDILYSELINLRSFHFEMKSTKIRFRGRSNLGKREHPGDMNDSISNEFENGSKKLKASPQKQPIVNKSLWTGTFPLQSIFLLFIGIKQVFHNVLRNVSNS